MMIDMILAAWERAYRRSVLAPKNGSRCVLYWEVGGAAPQNVGDVRWSANSVTIERLDA